MRARDWLHLVRLGDGISFLLAAALVVALGLRYWQQDHPDKAEIRARGRLVAVVSLNAPRMIDVPGPIGTTRIEIAPGRARVASDPGPRQYCVRQEWLTRSGAVAICAPNEVTLTLVGHAPAYDSLGY